MAEQAAGQTAVLVSRGTTETCTPVKNSISYESLTPNKRLASNKRNSDIATSKTVQKYANTLMLIGAVTTMTGLIDLTRQRYTIQHPSIASSIAAYTMYTGLIFLISAAIVSYTMRNIENFLQEAKSKNRKIGVRLRLLAMVGALITAAAAMEEILHSIVKGTNSTPNAFSLHNKHLLISPVFITGMGIILIAATLSFLQEREKARKAHKGESKNYYPHLNSFFVRTTLTGITLTGIGGGLMASGKVWSTGTNFLLVGVGIVIAGNILDWLSHEINSTDNKLNKRQLSNITALKTLGAFGMSVTTVGGVAIMHDALSKNTASYMPQINQWGMITLMTGVAITLISIAAAWRIEKPKLNDSPTASRSTTPYT